MRAHERPDEHTTIAIRASGEQVQTQATVTVPSTGIDLADVERALIRFALELHHGNRTHAAAFLGLSRSALLYRMQKYALASRDSRQSDGSEQS